MTEGNGARTLTYIDRHDRGYIEIIWKRIDDGKLTVLLDGISTLGKLLDVPIVQIAFISDKNLTVIQ